MCDDDEGRQHRHQPAQPDRDRETAHRMPRARICSLEYRESAQWGAAATKSQGASRP